METEADISNHHNVNPNIYTGLLFSAKLACLIACASTHPEECMAVDHHGALDQLIGALQKVMTGDDAGIVDQYVHISHLSTHLLSCRIHTLTLSHITRIGVDLGLERRDLLYPSNRSCRAKEMINVINEKV